MTGEAGGKKGRPHKIQGHPDTRSRLDELTFGTFNVRSPAVNGIKGIGLNDTLLRPCAAKGCEVIGLQKIKRDGTSEMVASGCRVFFSGGCSEVKGRKEHHGIGLVIKDDVVKKARKEGIAIECISVRPLKAQIKFCYACGRLRPDCQSPGGAEGTIYGSPQKHCSINACSGLSLGFNRRERQDREEG